MAVEEEVKNGDTTAAEEEAGPMIGPGPAKQRHKRPLEFERAFLDALPSAQMYAQI